MEAWFVIIVSISLCLLIRAFFNLLFSPNSQNTLPLPPCPIRFPIVGNFLLLRRSISQIESLLRPLHAKHGPIVTLGIGPRLAIFIADRSLAHKALIQNGVVFSDRPKPLETARILNQNQHNINSASYGPTWRLLRRNLASEMLHPTRIHSFSGTRRRVLDQLVDRLKSDSELGNSVRVIDYLQYAMFCLLVFMCFGERLDDKRIKDVEIALRNTLLGLSRFRVLNFWPSITRVLFRKRWEEFFEVKKKRDDVLIPLVRARKKAKEERLEKLDEGNDEGNFNIVSYVDTLLDLEWPEENRKIDESEIVTLCSEFINAGTDTTATALQWIMANLVKYSNIQERLVGEIREVMGDREDKEVKESDLNRMPYLKSVVLEGLRRHPPAHFVVPHAVSEDVVLNDYLIPKNASINFMVAEMGLDPKVWEDPMDFKPERFLKSEKNDGGEEEALEFDITGSKEIKMMPFGVGRRMCPGFNLAMLHLEYFVANLVWNFEWKASNGDVDLTETQEFTMVMKNPLQVLLSPRL